MLGQYGDDSVAQLGSAHVACEGVSNVLTKVLERGRLMSYLEQSTRYVPYTERPGGRWKYVTPAEIGNLADRRRYRSVLDNAFETYARFIDSAEAHFQRVHPQTADDEPAAYRRAIRARALDTVRGLLPAATSSNLGIHGSGQAFEALLLRLEAHDLHEANSVGAAMLAELRKVIPAFVQRVDRADRGQRTVAYLRERALATCLATRHVEDDACPGPQPDGNQVRLIDWKGDGEAAVLAAALHPHTAFTLPRRAARRRADAGRAAHQPDANDRRQPAEPAPPSRPRVRARRLHLRGHRRLRRVPRPATPPDAHHRLAAADHAARSRGTGRHRRDPPGSGPHGPGVIHEAEALYDRLFRSYGPAVAQYAVPMAFRIRFTMRMNAREAMHVIELRTQPAGHPSYRCICQQMHRLIREQAGHEAIAEAIRFANHDEAGLGRIGAENRQERATAKHAPTPAA